MEISRRLPGSYNVRWSTDRKIAVVLAVRIGMMSLAEVKIRYALGIREFREWNNLIDDTTLPGDKRMQVDNVIRLIRTESGAEVPDQTGVEAA